MISRKNVRILILFLPVSLLRSSCQRNIEETNRGVHWSSSGERKEKVGIVLDSLPSTSTLTIIVIIVVTRITTTWAWTEKQTLRHQADPLQRPGTHRHEIHHSRRCRHRRTGYHYRRTWFTIKDATSFDLEKSLLGSRYRIKTNHQTNRS